MPQCSFALDKSTPRWDYLCPDLDGLLSCGNVYVKIQRLAPTSKQDDYDYTTGLPPMRAGAFDLSSYGSGSFCNSGPPQLLLVSAIYIGPTILGDLMPNGSTVNYNGQAVHVTLSTVGLVSESYSPAAASQGAAAPC